MAHNPNDPDTTIPLDINPATGLPMVDDTGLDVGGSPYGVDIYQPQYTPQPIYEPSWPAAGGWEPW